MRRLNTYFALKNVTNQYRVAVLRYIILCFIALTLMIGIGALSKQNVYAQTATATLSGTIYDENKNVITGVTIKLIDKEKGSIRQTKANSNGIYVFTLIPPGKYDLIASYIGFKSQKSENIILNVGERQSLNLTMIVGEIGDTVFVSESNTSSDDSSIGTIINQTQIIDLPSITRNPYDFAALAPGATRSNEGRGIGVSMNGQRLVSGNFLLNGSENNDSYDGNVGQSVPLESVSEYQLITGNYTAEFGRNSGFIANVITKSGSNDFHGSLYYFNRNSRLTANSFHSNANGLPRPIFNRNQFGVSLGGPIKRDKLFFYSAFEPIIVRSYSPQSFFVPTKQLLAISSPGTQAIFKDFPPPGNISSSNIRLRAVCPYGQICDPESGEGLVTIPAFAFVSRIGASDAGAGTPQNTYLSLSRVDYNLSQSTTLAFTYALQDVNNLPIVFGPYSPKLDLEGSFNNQRATLNMTKVWSNRLVTESRVNYSLVSQFAPPTLNTNTPYILFFEDITTAFPNPHVGAIGRQHSYQFYQSASLTSGNHNVIFGGQYNHLRDKHSLGTLSVGYILDTQSLIDGTLLQYSIPLDPKGALPGQTLSPPFSAPNAIRHFRYNDISFYINDTWKVSSRVTLSAGLRWEYFGPQHSPGHEKELDANFYLGAGSNMLERLANGNFIRAIDAPDKYKGNLYLPDKNNFAPRLGITYDLTGNGRTIIRSGIGVFYDRNYGDNSFFVSMNPPVYSSATFDNVTLTPSIISDPYSILPNLPITLPRSSVSVIDQDLRTAYTVQWSLGLERQALRTFVLKAEYIGSRGNKLYSGDYINRAGSGELLGRPGTRLVRNVSGLSFLSNNGFSTYHGLQLRADNRFLEKQGLMFGINYTWSHSIDNLSSARGDDITARAGLGFLDAFNPKLDKGSSDFDSKHKIAVNFVWRIPFVNKAPSIVKHILGGWQASGIILYQSGQPFSLADSLVDNYRGETARPLVRGSLPNALYNKLVPDAITPNTFLILPINQVRSPLTFECLPDATPFACGSSVNGPFVNILGRNTFRRPGTSSQDFAISKDMSLNRIKENMKLQFRMELYNAFNHSNLYLNYFTNDVAAFPFNSPTDYSAGVTASYGTRGNPSFFGEARQIVMALKVIF